MEIEKKYRVIQIPENLDQFEAFEIEQCYLSTRPVLRIRKKNDDYILTYKNRDSKECKEITDVCVAQEVELPLTSQAYCHLKEKADGIPIRKTRYCIPYESYRIELDVFHDAYEGMYLAEVEFPSVEESRRFSPPNWFGEDVSGDYHYTNSYLALKNNSLQES